MTDEQIIKALDFCSNTLKPCEECPLPETDRCSLTLMRESLHIIESQQEEIEQWKEEANKYQNMWCATTEDIQMAKDEAVREFAEKLKEKATSTFYEERKYVDAEDIDELVKEMTEGE